MVKDIIEIAIKKLGNKRQLGIALGFPTKFAGQRVQKMIDNPNIKMNTFIKLLKEAELFDLINIIITNEKEKLN